MDMFWIFNVHMYTYTYDNLWHIYIYTSYILSLKMSSDGWGGSVCMGIVWKFYRSIDWPTQRSLRTCMNMLLVGQRSWRIGLSIKNATSCHMAVWRDCVMRRLVEYLVKGGNQWPPEVGGRLFLDWGAFVSRAARVGKKLKGLDARKPAKHGYKSLKMLHIL